MADPLTIITGIFAISFLLFYLSSLLSKDHDALKLILAISGLLFILFIPSQFEKLDQSCSIIPNGTAEPLYTCYYSNGSKVTNFGDGNNIGGDSFIAFVTLLRIIFIYVLAYVGFKFAKSIGVLDRIMKRWRRKFR